MSTTHTQEQIIRTALTALHIKPTAQEVYVDLMLHGTTPARLLAQRLSMPRSSVYDHLEPLIARGLVASKDIHGKTFFEVHDVRDLGKLLEAEEDALTLLRARFDHIKHTLSFVGGGKEAKIKFYEGKEGLTTLLHEMLWDAAGTIYTVWPYHEMLQVLGAETLVSFNEKRVRQKIKLETIWVGAPKKHEHLWKGNDAFVVRKYAPASYVVPMSYSIYGDKVAFVSAQKECYGFVVYSADFAQLMRMQFSLLAQVSK